MELYNLHAVSQVTLTVVLIIAAYLWMKRKKLESKLKWIPKAPGHSVFGNVFDFGKSTETLDVMSKLLRKTNNLCVVDLLVTKLIVVSDPNVVDFLLTTTKILTKSHEYRFLNRWLGCGLLTSTGQRWKKSRKIITPAFHFSILGPFISVYEAKTDIMIKLLEKEVEKDSIDIFPYITMCSLDIICETSMGISINAQIERQTDYVRAVKEMCRITVDRAFSIIKQIDFLYPLTKDYYKELQYVKTLHSYTNSVIHSRKQQLKKKINEKESLEQCKSQEEDLDVKKKVAFLDLLLQSTVDGEPLPDWYIREEVDTLMFEGHDTTSSAMSFTLFCLANHQEVQARAFEEQKLIFGEDRSRPTTFQDIKEMKYLELVIKETLRMYPSVPFIGRSTDADIQYKDGLVFPKGFSIVVAFYDIHKNPKLYPDPEKFDPSRFERMDGSLPFTYIPFSAGPRNCIGQKFAMQEMKTVISKVLRSYELVPATPKHNLILAAETVLKSVNGIKIKLLKRKWD